MRTHRLLIAAVAATLGLGAVAHTAVADTVTLKNGDKLTGTVGTIADGKLKFTHAQLGEITIDLANVETFSTDAPATIQPKAAPAVKEPIASGNATSVKTAGGQEFTLAAVRAVNPPAQKWTGSIVGALSVDRGNSDTFDATIAATAQYRRMTEVNNDRFTLAGSYSYGDTGLGDEKVVDTDKWDAQGKYDRFWTEKLYGFASFKVEHDRIAALEYRLTPGVGLGYQWHESPVWNFYTEAGVSYVYEKYESDTEEFVALRLAYHYDRKVNDKVTVFHNLEWLPAFEDPSDYILNTDVGARFAFTKNFFAEVKFQLERDSQPAEGAEKNDLRYLVGLGWQF